ncbi:MAG: filamentous hemagglutinin N-terminal domain-containing protein [Succinivibrio sp.]|nr:filamentous hemagglutinin N-terminal domain-containing protein [Succinivibrio sp.]
MKVTISKLFIFSLLAMAIKSAHSAAALPTGEKIIHGDVSVSRGPNSMFISSNSDRNVISWNDFSVAKGNSVVFSGTDATFLNIVKSSNISVIDGNVSCIGNNNIYLINPNGINVGITGSVKANKVILSTSKLTQENVDNFIDTGDFEFNKKGMGKVKLIGTLRAENTVIDGSQIIIRDISNIKVETGILDSLKPLKDAVSIHSSIKRIDIGSSKKVDLEKELGLTKEDGLIDHTDETAISTKEEFLNIVSDPSGRYFITNDIDLGTLNSAITGTNDFSGKIDGAFNSITYKLEGKGTNLEKKIGLFSTLNGSTIENLKIKNPSISVSSPENSTYIGGLAGVIKNSTLKNVEVDGLTLTFSNLENKKIYAGGLAGLATYEGASSNFENVSAGFSTKTQKHLFTRDNYIFGSVLGELKDELHLTGANFGKTDFSDDYSLGVINAIGYSQATASIDNEYQHNSGEFIKADGFYQNSGFFIPYFIDSDKIFITDSFDKVYNYDDLVGNNKYFNLNDYVDLSYKYANGIQKEGTCNHDYSSKNGGQTFYFVKNGNKSESATHTISIEGPMGKIEADDNYDLGYIADEEPDPSMGKIDESDLSFDSDFDCNLLPDEEFEKTPENEQDFDSAFTNDNNPDEDFEHTPENDNDFDNAFTNTDLPDEEFEKTDENDNDFDNAFTNADLPDEEFEKTDENDSDFDNAFTNTDLPDEEYKKTDENDHFFDFKFGVDDEIEDDASSEDNYYYERPKKKQKAISDIVENKKVVFNQKQRSTNLSFQNNYHVVGDIISKSLLSSLSLLEEPNRMLADNSNDSEKEEELS